jgi:hypothetical protein
MMSSTPSVLLVSSLLLVTHLLANDNQPKAPIPGTKDLPPGMLLRPNYQPVSPIPEIKVRVEGFLAMLVKGQVPPAFDLLLKDTRLSAREENVSELIRRTEQALGLYGKMTDYEVIDTYQVGSRMLVTTYLSALQVQPLRWRFVYYKADKSWMLIDLRVDDHLADLVEGK